MIEITESAKSKIISILEEENNPNIFLRTYVQGGGCSGFQYGFSLEEQKSEDDFEFDVGGFRLLIDAASMQYLSGSTIDYRQTLTSSSFTIKNPNSTGQCGCGSSFSV